MHNSSKLNSQRKGLFTYEYRRNKELFVALQQLRDMNLAAFAATELHEMFSGTQQQQGVKVSGRNVGRPSHIAAVYLRTFH
jgi:hypothetical protein